MERPTAAEIESWSQVRFSRYGLDTDKLEAQVARACSYIAWVTGQDFAAVTVSATGLQVSDAETLLKQAVQMRTEQVVMQGRPGHVDSAASNEVVQSMSVGPFSESRRDPQRQANQRSVNTWPALDELLWMLMTADRFSFWYGYVTGQSEPDMIVEEIDWRGVGTAATFLEPFDMMFAGG